MKKLIFLFLTVSLCAYGQTNLSDKAEISVLTLGPHQGQVYTAFGHSAFRVFDPVNQIDLAYNYGVFDYDKPNFYLDFARGSNYYMLGVSDYRQFEYVYMYYNRYIHEQKLNLSTAQKQKLFDYLEWNAKPENREYLYDYFYDNCATKIPAVLKEVFEDDLKFDHSHIVTNYSIRDLTDLYLQQQPWGDLGIDLCLGLPMDKKATPYEYMFLPEFVEAGMDHATINSNGVPVPLVKQKINTFEPRTEEARSSIQIHPLLVFGLFFLVIAYLSYRDIMRHQLMAWLDGILFSVIGILGLVLILLWTATDHRAAANNLNIVWALPTHLIAVFAFRQNPAWLGRYFFGTAMVCIILLIGWPFLPQRLPYAIIPLVMAIALRAYTQYLVRKPLVVKQ
jgi:hypothetical protein